MHNAGTRRSSLTGLEHLLLSVRGCLVNSYEPKRKCMLYAEASRCFRCLIHSGLVAGQTNVVANARNRTQRCMYVLCTNTPCHLHRLVHTSFHIPAFIPPVNHWRKRLHFLRLAIPSQVSRTSTEESCGLLLKRVTALHKPRTTRLEVPY